MVKLLDRVKQAVSGTASSTTLGAAAEGFRTFNTAGAATNDVCRYAIEDDNGAFEIGTIVINSATTGTRTVQISSNSNNALTLTGNAVIFATLSAADLEANPAPRWTTTPASTLDLDSNGSTAVTLTGVAIDENWPVRYSWDGYSGTSLYDADSLPPQLASAPVINQSTGVTSLVGSSTGSNAGTYYHRSRATDGINTLWSTTAVKLAFGFSLSSASYDSKSFSVTTQETSPRAVVFNTDGTKMFVVGTTNDTVFQYTLSTAFDVSTASYANKSFSAATQDTSAVYVQFNTDGTRMFVAGYNNQRIYQYTLSTAFDVSTASYSSTSLSVSAQDATIWPFVFNGDGTKLYIVGKTNDAVFQYTLSTAFDLSTASYANKSFSIATQSASAYGIALNTAGTKMFISDGNDSVYQYTLSTAFDVSTASYANLSFSAAAQDNGMMGLTFNSNGTKMFTVGYDNDSVYQYSTLA
mgnify:CR=1 FL=1